MSWVTRLCFFSLQNSEFHYGVEMTLEIHEILLENQTKHNLPGCECPQERDQTPERERKAGQPRLQHVAETIPSRFGNQCSPEAGGEETMGRAARVEAQLLVNLQLQTSVARAGG